MGAFKTALFPVSHVDSVAIFSQKTGRILLFLLPSFSHFMRNALHCYSFLYLYRNNRKKFSCCRYPHFYSRYHIHTPLHTGIYQNSFLHSFRLRCLYCMGSSFALFFSLYLLSAGSSVIHPSGFLNYPSLFLITFSLVNSSLSFSSNALLIV